MKFGVANNERLPCLPLWAVAQNILDHDIDIHGYDPLGQVFARFKWRLAFKHGQLGHIIIRFPTLNSL